MTWSSSSLIPWKSLLWWGQQYHGKEPRVTIRAEVLTFILSASIELSQALREDALDLLADRSDSKLGVRAGAPCSDTTAHFECVSIILHKSMGIHKDGKWMTGRKVATYPFGHETMTRTLGASVGLGMAPVGLESSKVNRELWALPRRSTAGTQPFPGQINKHVHVLQQTLWVIIRYA